MNRSDRWGPRPSLAAAFYPRAREGNGPAALHDNSGANFGAPFFDFGFDRVAHFAGAGKLFVVCAGDSGRVRETPMRPRGNTGEGGAALGAGFIANGDDISKALAGLERVMDGFGLLAVNVYADFPHGFDNDGVEFAGFEPGAVDLELFAANFVEERFRHLAAG